MNTCLYKHNLNSLSKINDWTPIIFNQSTKYIDIDDRYLTYYRSDTDINIKQIHQILKLCFQHYFIMVEFPITYFSNSQSVKDLKNEYLNFIEMANQGLLKIYNYYNYYKYQDVHLLKDLNLMNSIQVNQYRIKYTEESDLDGLTYTTTTNYFKKNNADKIINDEIKSEYFFNTNSLFDFIKNKTLNIKTLKLDTIQESSSDIEKITIDNTVEKSSTDNINNDCSEQDTNSSNNLFTKSFSELVDKQPIVLVAKENDIESQINYPNISKECDITDNNVTCDSANSANSANNGDNSDCTDKANNSDSADNANRTNDNTDRESEYSNMHYHATFTESCITIAKDMYQNACLFFFSVKTSIMNQINKYFNNGRKNN